MSDEQRVERSVDVPLEPERAWETVTDPDELERWLAPDVELDLREGGDVFVRDDDGRERHGTVVTVDPPQRLVYTWDTDGSRDHRRDRARPVARRHPHPHLRDPRGSAPAGTGGVNRRGRPHVRGAVGSDPAAGRLAAGRPRQRHRHRARARAADLPPGGRQAPGGAARRRPGRARAGRARDSLPVHPRAADRGGIVDGERRRRLGCSG